MRGDLLRVATRCLHPHKQGPHAAEQQPGLERSYHCAHVVPHRLEPLPELVVPGRHQRPGEHVGMAVQVFGRRVHHHIGPERKGLGEHGCRHRRVHGEARAGPVGELRRRGDVGDDPRGISGRLDPDQLGPAGLQRAAERGEVGHVHKFDLQAPVLGETLQPVAQAPISHLGRDDMIAGPEGEEDTRGRGHARAEQHRARAALQVVQQGLGLIEGRIVGADITAARTILVVRIPQVGRRRVDRRGDRARLLVHPAEGLGGGAGGLEMFGVHRGVRFRCCRSPRQGRRAGSPRRLS